MTALSITAANVALVSGPTESDAIAGEAFAAGALLYKSDVGTWLKAQNDGTAVEAGSNNIGVALATADAAGARISVALPGAIVSVGAGVAGVVYIVGATAGQIVPVADGTSTNKITPVALGIGSNKLQLMRNYNPGAVL